MGVMAVLPLLITNSKYLVHGGEINFWYNNWLGDESLAKIIEVREALMLQVHSIFVNGRWDERKLREIVPTEIFSKIISSKVRAENIDHVLCDGEVARRVWEYFAAIFGIRLPQQRSWSRCAACMEDVASNWETVVQMVKSFLLNITVQVRKFSKLSSRDESRLKELNCPVIPITVKQPKVIAWSRPGDGCFKLNVDGGLNGNPGLSDGVAFFGMLVVMLWWDLRIRMALQLIWLQRVLRCWMG
ncbi:hypothetical protein LWI29_005584 [Acer saccharum]|uniref:Uncharacterized protein n=1 Tax=Acer saccharum TaxID=4024 RepID=A0AA39T9X3_ACESA|nr:hypothetical protein LWI29_005584 [Acer saccharum]